MGENVKLDFKVGPIRNMLTKVVFLLSFLIIIFFLDFSMSEAFSLTLRI